MQVTFTNHAASQCETWTGLSTFTVQNMLETGKYALLRSAERSQDHSEILLICDPERERFSGVVVKRDPQQGMERVTVITLLRQEKIEENTGGPISIRSRCEVAKLIMPDEQFQNWLQRDRYRGKIEGMRLHKERLFMMVYADGQHLGEVGILPQDLRMMSVKQLARAPAFWAHIRERLTWFNQQEGNTPIDLEAITEIRLVGSKGTEIDLWRSQQHEPA